MISLHDVTYRYYRKNSSNTCYLVLHGGGSQGIESDFMQNLAHNLEGLQNSVLAFNFKYCERGEEESSGPELLEEQASLMEAMEFLRSEGYQHIIIVAKSLAAVTASYLWGSSPALMKNTRLAILGYFYSEVLVDNIGDDLLFVVQGENDRFINPGDLRAYLKSRNITAKVIDIKGGDHSYRDSLKEPMYQQEAIKLTVKELSLLTEDKKTY